jgi:glycosyltransferase involved in cell wall biosynthesis
MRIAFITETFLPKVDGIVNTLCYLLDYLAERNHETLLLAPRGAPPRYAATPVISFPSLPFPLYPELQISLPTRQVRRHLVAFQPDLVHIINPVTLGAAGMWAARRLGTPLVASYHTDVPGYAQRWGFGFLQRPLWAALRGIHNRADLNLCPSGATLAELAAHDFRRLRVWTRGVDTERFHPRKRSDVWRRRLSGDRPDAPLLLYVGRLSPEKRVDWLRPLLKALPQARLAIVGDGPARSKLEETFAGAATTFTGYLRGEALARAYAAADLFVFPSANETLGNVVLEAMASGLPVVAARAGGPLDVVVEGENGLMFAPDDQDEMITAVARLVADPSWAGRLGRRARRQMEETRGWEQVFTKLVNDYRSVAQQHAPGVRRRPQSAVELVS